MTVDIYMPFAGDLELFQRAVNSVLAQKSDNWRLTVVDDRGSDSSDARVITRVSADAHAYDEEKVRYVRNEGRHGQAAARDLCIKTALTVDPLPGEDTLVAFVGADDLVRPDFVAEAIAAHEQHPDAAFVQTSVDNIGLNDDLNSPAVRGLADRVKDHLTPFGEGPQSGEKVAAQLLRGNYLRDSAITFKRSALRDANGDPRTSPDVPFASNLAMYLAMVAEGKSFAIMPKAASPGRDPVTRAKQRQNKVRLASVRYRRHAGSTTARVMTDGTGSGYESDVFDMAKVMMAARGWQAAERAAGTHVTSKLRAVMGYVGAKLSRADKEVVARFRAHAFAGLGTVKSAPVAAEDAGPTALVKPEYRPWVEAQLPRLHQLAAEDTAANLGAAASGRQRRFKRGRG